MIELSNTKSLGINNKKDPILIIGDDLDFEFCVSSVLALQHLAKNNFELSSSIWDLITLEDSE